MSGPKKEIARGQAGDNGGSSLSLFALRGVIDAAQMRRPTIIEHDQIAMGPAERRTAPRIPANDWPVRIEHEGDHAVGQCRDISDVGAKLASAMHLGLNDIVNVVFPSFASLAGRVVWTKGEECGVAFDRKIDCSALLTAADDLSADDEDAGAPERQPQFQPGLRVKVLLGSGEERAALVRWTNDNYAGLYLLDRQRIGELPSEPFALIEH